MKLLILTGMSGAGKSTAFKMLEDMGYYCVDNLPIPLFRAFIDLTDASSNGPDYKVALGIDVRSGESIHLLQSYLVELREAGKNYDILFLDAEDEVLVKRYKETRRNHPLSGTERISAGIAKERETIQFLKEEADYIIDTSHLLTRELKEELQRIFIAEEDFKSLFVTVMSFGFKYGIPADADLVFDVRFLPNPYYDINLRPKTGNDKEIQDFVMASKTTHVFLEKLSDMVNFLIPNYISEGKNQLVIAVGCTGGKHRSVTVANKLYEAIASNESIGIKIEHRDIGKDAARGK